MSIVTIGSRLEKALEDIFGKKNNKEIAEKYGFTQQAIGKLKTKSAINETMCIICEGENINLNWLQTGKGEVFIVEDNSLSTSQNITAPENAIAVNFYPDVYASAGLGNTLIESTSQTKFMDKQLLTDVFNVRNFDSLDMIKVVGDSMSPIINDGEVLFIERGAHAKNGDTVIAILNDELYVKRLYKDPFGEWIRLESENKEFPHIELNTPQKISMLNIIGIARSKVKVY